MKQVDFERRLSAEWLSVDQWMEKKLKGARGISNFVRRFPIILEQEVTTLADKDFPAAYRRLCQHLAIAKTRLYSQTLIDFLQDLVHRGHSIMYRPKPARLSRILKFVVIDFPCLVRKHAKVMWVSAALFFLPLLFLIIAIQVKPEIAQQIFSPKELFEYQTMYDPSNDRLGRDSGEDLYMFGHYVMNNISIGFRTFASGFFAGIGSILVLIYNGVAIGGIAGFLTQIGFGGPFWRFVVGHSGPELTAIVISGGAGMQLGLALIMPGRKRLSRALIDAGKDGAILCFGVFLMLLVAAFIEAFWSAQTFLPDVIRFGFGLGLWVLIGVWLLLSGRGYESQVDELQTRGHDAS